MTSNDDPLQLLRRSPMSSAQIIAVAICVLINVIDGFDILAASFTASDIGRTLSLSPAQLGLLFSASPLGMMIGALFLSPLADIIGRRQLTLICLGLVTVAMVSTAASANLPVLLASRAVTGIGVGAIMAAINTVVAELSNDRRRDLAVCLQAAGFPLGGVIGGLSGQFLAELGWRSVFMTGAVFSLLLIPAVLAAMPESLDFLMARRPPNALQRANKLLARLKLPTLALLPEARQRERLSLAGSIRLLTTLDGLLICASFFLLMYAFYFLTSWIPKILTDAGASAKVGVSSAVMLSVGGVLGDIVFAGLTTRWRAVKLAPLFAVACFAMTVVLVSPGLSAAAVMPVALVLGFFLYATMASHYAIVPSVFPALIRNSGTGLALGVGRLGATIGPAIGGLLLSGAPNHGAVVVGMSAPLLVCGLLAYRLSRRKTPL